MRDKLLWDVDDDDEEEDETDDVYNLYPTSTQICEQAMILEGTNMLSMPVVIPSQNKSDISMYPILTEYFGRLQAGQDVMAEQVHIDYLKSSIDIFNFVNTHFKVKQFSSIKAMAISFLLTDGNLLFVTSYASSTSLLAIGTPEFCKSVKKYSKFNENDVLLTWSYNSPSGDTRNVEVKINEPLPIFDEYYPFIEGGVEAFFDNYMKASAPILIFIGEPGTGKTSLLRHFIYSRKLPSEVTFDTSLMAMDSYYIDYLTSEDSKLLVIEDADLLLSSRDSSQNETMSKLLNVSDGLVNLVNKKIIFTTNLSNVKSIDYALTRPGRCYEVIKFRPLTADETRKACAKAGINKEIADGKEYNLSQIFNDQKFTKLPQIGFRG